MRNVKLDMEDENDKNNSCHKNNNLKRIHQDCTHKTDANKDIENGSTRYPERLFQIGLVMTFIPMNIL